jgi:hypothetical protein
MHKQLDPLLCLDRLFWLFRQSRVFCLIGLAEFLPACSRLLWPPRLNRR